MRLLTLGLMICWCSLGAFAEDAPAPIDSRMGAADDAYMNRQAEALLAEVNETLGRVAPQLPEPAERRLALRLVDAVLHDTYAPARPPVRDFFHGRIERAITAMESTKVEDGATLWKLYNHGFVVRTASVTLGFDLHRGTRGFRLLAPDGSKTPVETAEFPIPEALADRLVKQCDVLFISHKHGDHADPYVAQAFLDQGKPVIAPTEVLEGTPLNERITHLERGVDLEHNLPLQNGAQSVRVIAFPGRQGGPDDAAVNNVVLVTTAEGLSFVHNGDQINDPYPEFQEDFKWIDKVKDTHKVDVFMTNCWTNDILRMTRGFNPKLVMPGHENELGHPVWDRVPYWGDVEFIASNLLELKKEYPVLVMTWGESYHYSTQGK